LEKTIIKSAIESLLDWEGNGEVYLFKEGKAMMN